MQLSTQNRFQIVEKSAGIVIGKCSIFFLTEILFDATKGFCVIAASV